MQLAFHKFLFFYVILMLSKVDVNLISMIKLPLNFNWFKFFVRLFQLSVSIDCESLCVHLIINFNLYCFRFVLVNKLPIIL